MTADGRAYGLRDTAAPSLSLFLSLGTLLCCALPAVLIAAGLGAVVAGAIGAVPGLVWLSEHRDWLFAGSAAMMLGSALLQRRAARLPCPADPRQAAACQRLRRFSGVALAAAAGVWLLGALAAYVLPPLLFG